MSSLTIHMGSAVPDGYFIAPDGDDDTGDGSIGSPWRTIFRFYQSAVPGDTLWCRGGDYTDWTATVACGDAGTDNSPSGYVWGVSGTAVNPITVRNYPGETPHFIGSASATGNNFLAFRRQSNYHVIDGLTASNFNCNGNAIIWIGHDGDTQPVGHITIRNCHFTARVGGLPMPHGIYLSAHSDSVTIEDNVLIGDYPNSDFGAGIEVYHTPGSTNFLVQRNVFKNWKWALQCAEAGATGSFLHNTCLGSNIHLYADLYTSLLIKDCAGDTPGAAPFYPAGTEGDLTGWGGTWASVYCFWNQTFDSNYYLVAGQSGRGAASDGLDAGALDW